MISQPRNIPSRPIALLATTAIALLALAAGPAAGSDREVVRSTISIKFKGGGSGDYAEQAYFTGKVKAKSNGKGRNRVKPDAGKPKRECVQDRRVKIIHKRDGEVLRKTRTDKKGDYRISAGGAFVPGDRYFAKVESAILKLGKTKVVCKGATSKVITAG